MRALVQRVSRARVVVDDETTGQIGPGLLALVGVTHEDGAPEAEKLARKLWGLRVFEDEAGAMNLAVADTSGEVLVVSQFTLYADTRKGRRPSFVDAARPEQAERLVAEVVERLRGLGARVGVGRFGAHMDVELVNHGPVTLLVEV